RLGALSISLGEGADTQVLQEADQECIVDGEFSIASYSLRSFFEQNDLDYQAQTVLRREINPAGRSRAFINDTPVTLSQLKVLAGQLVDIHSQHQTLLLNEQGFQLRVVDAFCDHTSLFADYQSAFEKWKAKKTLLIQLQSQEASQQADLDYKQYLLQELEEANLQGVGELQTLEEELKVLSHSEEIQQKLQEAIQLSDHSERALLVQLQELKSILGSVAPHHEAIRSLSDRVESTYIELKDIVSETEHLSEGISHDPQRLHFLNERISLLNRLLQKHKLLSSDELLEMQKNLASELNGIQSLSEQISILSKEVKESYQSADLLAQKLAQNRSKSIPTIEKEIAFLLAELGMPFAKVQINQHPTDELSSKGKEDITFYFSANKGAAPQEIARIASGGELSRLMLCIKYLIANKTNLPSIIFDEIDTGVSGEIAHKMGELMQQMAQNMQVMGITHLPQVAAKGNAQLLVKKDSSGEKTQTSLLILTKEERIQELAKMLSGKEVTDTALSNAQELLGA
ncbi:MAG: DNA repair protein RecN, partial [Bacteroidetes bacterium]|nr:DNA repair protein RecN [Bacteroidota bacterium]